MTMQKNSIKTIAVKDFTNIQEEFIANAALSPGHLVEVLSTNKVRKHASAGKTAERMFAIEDELQGKGVDDAYVAADRVQVKIFRSGDVVNAILADGESVSIGDKVVSNGDGCLKKADKIVVASASEDVEPYLESIIGTAVEALNLSGSSGEESSGGKAGDVRFLVRIL